MCACTNIFAKPSMPQPCEARGGVSREGVLGSPSCGYYTMKQKCVLAQTFLRSRQCRSRAKHGEASAAKGCSAALPAVIIPQIQARLHEFAGKPANSQNAADQLHRSENVIRIYYTTYPEKKKEETSVFRKKSLHHADNPFRKKARPDPRADRSAPPLAGRQLPPAALRKAS